MDFDDLQGLLAALVAGIVELEVFTLMVTLVVLDWRSVVRRYRTGLFVGLAAFAMIVPAVALSIVYLDVESLVRKAGAGSPDVNRIAVYVGIVIGVGVQVLAVGWHMLVYCVAAGEWDRAGLVAFPVLDPAGPRDGRPSDPAQAPPAGHESVPDALRAAPPFGETTAAAGEASPPGEALVGFAPVEILPATDALPVGTVGAADESSGESSVGNLRGPVEMADDPAAARTRAPWDGTTIAALVGVLAGVASAYAFRWLGVEESESLKRLLKLFPGLENASAGVTLPVVLLFVLSAAVTEELSYRGVVMGFIQRLAPRSRGTVVLAAVVSSLLWALLHLNMTNAPGAKLTQIFLLGLAFAWLARRYSVEAAIAAHAGLNVAATFAAFAIYQAGQPAV